MSRTSSFFTLGGQLASSGGRTLISDSPKLQLYQHRDQLNLHKVEVYLKPPHLNITLWEDTMILLLLEVTFYFLLELFIFVKTNQILLAKPRGW